MAEKKKAGQPALVALSHDSDDDNDDDDDDVHAHRDDTEDNSNFFVKIKRFFSFTLGAKILSHAAMTDFNPSL